jgi:hypothetical protein
MSEGRRMTLTIQFPPDVEAGLLSHAEAEGVDVSDFVQNLVLERISAKPSTAEVFRPAAELTFEERREHLRKFLESHAGNTVVLTDEAMERESIYGDRGL